MRVMLVEDDAMIGEAIGHALKDASYAVDWVRDGSTAVTAIGTQSYGIVLLDLGLPKKDGIEVLRHIRARDNPVPVLIITARDALEDRIGGLDAGADDYVLKPFEMGELLARMRAVVRRKGGSASPILTNGALALDPVTHESRTLARRSDCLHASSLCWRRYWCVQAPYCRAASWRTGYTAGATK